MCEYNGGLGNPNKNVLKGSGLDIHAQVARRGHVVSKNGTPSSPPKELTWKA